MSKVNFFFSCGVLIAYLDFKFFVVENEINECACRVLILGVTFDDADYILVNVYNTET